MYICICKVVTDHQIRDAVHDGSIRCWKELVRTTGCATQCGTCALTAKAICDQTVRDLKQTSADP